MTASLLRFDGPTHNSLDGVSDRDFCMELAAAVAITMVHLSRFSEEIILWCSWEFKFIELDDAFSTGSSIMPQKKNPDIAELVRGKAGRVIGGPDGAADDDEGLPLAYNKGYAGEDKEAVFDAVDTLSMCLTAFCPDIGNHEGAARKYAPGGGPRLYQRHRLRRLSGGQGLPFRDAYKVTGSLVAYCLMAWPHTGGFAAGNLPGVSPAVWRGCLRGHFLWNAA